ncbi:MAG: DUF4337 family protein [Nibricoccus sp.]
MAKIQIPDTLKADIPHTLLGRMMAATPVVMTVVATMLAGLASSEMTKAQYDRSLAAQQQSKAGDQWSFFQAKRLRSALQRNTLDLLQASNEVHPLDTANLTQAVAGSEALTAKLTSPETQTALELLQKGSLPTLSAPAPLPQEIKDAQHAIESLRPDPEVAAAVTKVTDDQLTAAILAGKERADALDAATKPINEVVDAIDTTLAQQPSSPAKRDFIAARLRFAAVRYDTEARLNQAIASLYEIQVRKNNLSAERHHQRSKRFFFGMLGAQMAVIISTFAIAARQRNLLWTLAAGAGVTALIFAAYVYLYV